MADESVLKVGNPLKRHPVETALLTGLGSVETTITKNKFHGATVGFCARQSILHTMVDPNYSELVSPASAFYFAIGSAMHQVVSGGLKRAGILVFSELKIEAPEFGPPKLDLVRGYVDNIIEIDGKLAITDVKSCGSLPKEPKMAHAAQARAYSLITGIMSAYIHYISRSVASWDGKLIQAVLKVDNSKTAVTMTATEMAKSHVFAQEDLLPPIPPHITNQSKCGFCPFKAFCWEGDETIPIDDNLNCFPEMATVEALMLEVDEYAQKYIDGIPTRREAIMEKINFVREFDDPEMKGHA